MPKKKPTDPNAFGPQDDDTLAHTIAAEAALELFAMTLNLTPLRLAAMLLLTYRHGRHTRMRAAFEEGADQAIPLARRRIAQQFGTPPNGKKAGDA